MMTRAMAVRTIRSQAAVTVGCATQVMTAAATAGEGGGEGGRHGAADQSASSRDGSSGGLRDGPAREQEKKGEGGDSVADSGREEQSGYRGPPDATAWRQQPPPTQHATEHPPFSSHTAPVRSRQGQWDMIGNGSRSARALTARVAPSEDGPGSDQDGDDQDAAVAGAGGGLQMPQLIALRLEKQEGRLV